MIEAALAYARQGWRVHPCRPLPEDKKRPYTRWTTQASSDPAQVTAYWERWPDALIAVCTGGGLVVVDDDRGTPAPDGDLAVTRTASTRSRGWHHWFISSEPVGCHVGIIPGVDIRGEGGYVIAPPSPGWDWHNDAPIQALPGWVLGAINAKRVRQRSTGFEPAAPGSVGEGYRHDYMVRFAGWAIRVLELEGQALVDACLEEYARACSPADAPPQNIRRIARSIERQDRRSA